jgi:hypothetical protein
MRRDTEGVFAAIMLTRKKRLRDWTRGKGYVIWLITTEKIPLLFGRMKWIRMKSSEYTKI